MMYIKAKNSPMILIPAGEFMMGCNDQVDKKCQGNEKPYHKVYLDAYLIDKFDVTQADYNECVDSKTCKANKKEKGLTDNRQPVVNVRWAEANTYCQWAGKRLPTEAEWEKAARGTDGRVYPWGGGANNIDISKTNFAASNIGTTTPVGNYPSGASPDGVMDIAGNVWQWLADWYDKNYYHSSADRNPKGPESGKSRVLRGGSWYDEASSLRTSYRFDAAPDRADNIIGFRCARTP
jgi:formylglycine-generating enzyme required for sulfatase activity